MSGPVFCDIHGMILGPAIHDSTLTAFSLSQPAGLDASFRRVSGEIVRAHFANIHEINFVNVRQQMIVSEIWAWKLETAPIALIIEDSAWRILFLGYVAFADIEKEIARRVKKYPGALLVQISSSYGGTIAAICERIHFHLPDSGSTELAL